LKKTLVLGASLKPNRYSNIVINMLREYNYEVIAFGLRKGVVADVEIITDLDHYTIKNIHTVTLYLNAQRQADYYDFVVKLNPKRVIFNPGTYNDEFISLLEKNNIEVDVACNLVLLRTEQY